VENGLIRAVFFDYDGVLTTDKTGSLTTNRYLSQAAGVDFSEVNAAFSQHSRALTLGKTTHAEIWQKVCSDLGRDLSINLLYEAFESTPVNAGMFSLARQLKASYSVGIITDNKKDRIDHLKKTQNLETLFSPIVVSAEIGTDKENTEIFLHALNCTSVSPEESVFIDNNRGNLIAPSALGLKTIFHDDEKNDIAALVSTLKTLGVVAGNA
jgi:putative hydrolase of the HAD superfamily